MSRLVHLFTFSLYRVRWLLVGLGVVLGGFQALLVLVGRALEKEGSYKQISLLVPSFIREMIGPAFSVFVTFQGTVCLGYFHALVLSMLVGLVIVIATEPAGEKETRFADLLLARPMPRSLPMWRSILMVLAVSAFVPLGMLACTALSLHFLAPPGVQWPKWQTLFSLVWNLVLLLWCWGAIALLVSTACKRRSEAAWMTALLALAMSLVDLGARMWSPMTPVAWLSPYFYFSPFELIAGQKYLLKNTLVLLPASVFFVACAVRRYVKRDL